MEDQEAQDGEYAEEVEEAEENYDATQPQPT